MSGTARFGARPARFSANFCTLPAGHRLPDAGTARAAGDSAPVFAGTLSVGVSAPMGGGDPCRRQVCPEQFRVSGLAPSDTASESPALSWALPEDRAVAPECPVSSFPRADRHAASLYWLPSPVHSALFRGACLRPVHPFPENCGGSVGTVREVFRRGTPEFHIGKSVPAGETKTRRKEKRRNNGFAAGVHPFHQK